jgi:hypothetical protein
MLKGGDRTRLLKVSSAREKDNTAAVELLALAVA